MDSIDPVDIDADGRFKYILVKVTDGSGTTGYIVRGYSDCVYHDDIFQKIQPGVESKGVACECVGGGRILHDPLNRKIEIFGYSTGYGKADHSITAEIVKKKFPNYNVTWTDDGY